MRETDGGFTAANPGSAHYGLPRILDNFAALCGFVLNAPLADLFAEGKAGKLAAAADAVCHGFLKEYQQFGVRGERRDASKVKSRVT